MKDLNLIFLNAKAQNYMPSLDRMSIENFAIECKTWQTKEGFYSFVLGHGGETGTTQERFVYAIEQLKKTLLSRFVNSSCPVTNALRIIERNTSFELLQQYESLIEVA